MKDISPSHRVGGVKSIPARIKKCEQKHRKGDEQKLMFLKVKTTGGSAKLRGKK